ncbi:hypothetical protein ACJX0J_008829, partial [Zea mays]
APEGLESSWTPIPVGKNKCHSSALLHKWHNVELAAAIYNCMDVWAIVDWANVIFYYFPCLLINMYTATNYKAIIILKSWNNIEFKCLFLYFFSISICYLAEFIL